MSQRTNVTLSLKKVENVQSIGLNDRNAKIFARKYMNLIGQEKKQKRE